MLNIIYMGTPDFAVPTLKALAASKHKISLVVAKPDAEKDRGKKLQSCPVKIEALNLGLNVETPPTLSNNPKFWEKLKALNPDLIVVAAYGMLLPKEVLEIPRLGCVNIHASLLPLYRGAAPIHRAVMEGQKETGITLMEMEEGLDSGAILAQKKTSIEDKTTEMLFDELSLMGADLLMEKLPEIEANTLTKIKQDESLVTLAPMVFKEEGVLDYKKSAKALCCLVRGFNSWPLASTLYKGQVMKVYEAEEGGKLSAYTAETVEAGKLIKADKTGLYIACGQEEVVILKKIQLPGKKAMDVSSWLLGNKIENGTIFGK